MKNLRIAIFGPNFAAAGPAGAAGGAWRLLRALTRHGHRITFYQPDLLGRPTRQVCLDPDGVRMVSYCVEGYLDLFECLEEAARAQVIIKFSGAGPFDALLEGAICEIRKPEAIAVLLDTDSHALSSRVRRDPADSNLALINEFDLILLTGGGIPLANTLMHLGAAECVMLDSAEDSESRPIVPPDSHFAPVTHAQLRAVEHAFARSLSRRAAPALLAAAP